MVFAMDGWYTYTIIIGARNQHTASGAYEFHIHRAYIIYGMIDVGYREGLAMICTPRLVIDTAGVTMQKPQAVPLSP